MADETNYRPLEGVKVLELSTMVAAGSCGRMLADWGATVIKVEAESGDMFRNFPKTFLVPCTMDENPLFDNLNAGKRGIVLNLKTPEGMEAMHRLLAEADVFLTNTRVKALKKLGLDYDSLKDKYPRLIEANISGFGEKGPKKDNPGFDTVAFWASSGFNADMMVEGPGSYPVYSSAGPGDIVTAMGLCYAITAALYKRTQTGKGDRVSSSLYGTALWCFHIMSVATEERYGYQYPKTREVSAPTGAPFRTKDNQWVMTTILKIEEQWPVLCNVLGVPELGTDPRYNTSLRQRDPEVRKYLMKRFEDGEIVKTKICPHCQKEFVPTSNRQIFCSKDCCYQARQDKTKADREAEKGNHYYRQRVCAVCGSTYWPTHSQQKFCSEECQKINHNEKSLEFYHKKQKEKSECKDLLQTKELVSSTNSSEIITIPA